MKEREKQQTKGRVVLAARVLFLELFTTRERPNYLVSIPNLLCAYGLFLCGHNSLFFTQNSRYFSLFFFFFFLKKNDIIE